MISYLEGEIISKENNCLVILTDAGVGYEARVAPAVFLEAREGQRIKLHTYFSVREGSQELFGMATLKELKFFKLLVGVSGVGPKSALHILSLGSVKEISAAVAAGDLNFLTKVSGIGRKTAERIIVELKEKIKDGVSLSEKVSAESAAFGDVVEALTEMGYSLAQAREAVRGVKPGTASEILKEALKKLGK